MHWSRVPVYFCSSSHHAEVIMKQKNRTGTRMTMPNTGKMTHQICTCSMKTCDACTGMVSNAAEIRYYTLSTTTALTPTRDGHEILKLKTEPRPRHSTSETEILVLPTEMRPRWDVGMSEMRPRRCYPLRHDQNVKVHVILIAVVQFGLFFTFTTSWRVNVIINYRLVQRLTLHT